MDVLSSLGNSMYVLIDHKQHVRVCFAFVFTVLNIIGKKELIAFIQVNIKLIDMCKYQNNPFIFNS